MPTTTTPEQTIELGRRIGRACRGGELISLVGELGSGKTQLAKGIADGLLVPDALRVVTSPTFVLHCRHEGRLVLHHCDAYRLASAAEFLDLGLLEQLDAGSVLLVEWADRVAQALPAPDLELRLSHAGGDARRIELSGRLSP